MELTSGLNRDCKVCAEFAHSYITLVSALVALHGAEGSAYTYTASMAVCLYYDHTKTFPWILNRRAKLTHGY